MKALKQNFSVFFIMLILFFSLGGNFALFSQKNTGNLSGIVTDEKGNPLPGVTIVAWSPPAKIAQTTDATGHFRFSNLPAGSYTVIFSLSGFKTVRKEKIAVQSGRTSELEITMELDVIEEEVTIIPYSPVMDQEKWVTVSLMKLQNIIDKLSAEIDTLTDLYKDFEKKLDNFDKRLKAVEEKIK